MPTPEELEQYAKEAAAWDARKNEPNLWNNLKKEGWVDAPESLPSAGNKMVAPRGEMSVKRLLPTDLCPCKSEKPFSECCRKPLKEGWTEENVLHLLFEERDTSDPEAPTFYAVMDLRMDGRVPPEEIVSNIAKRLHSPPVNRALDKLEWTAVNSKGLKMSMTLPEPEQPLVQGPAPKQLLDKDGKPVP